MAHPDLDKGDFHLFLDESLHRRLWRLGGSLWLLWLARTSAAVAPADLPLLLSKGVFFLQLVERFAGLEQLASGVVSWREASTDQRPKHEQEGERGDSRVQF